MNSTDSKVNAIKFNIWNKRDFKALIYADNRGIVYKEILKQAHYTKLIRYGKVIQLYVPLYLSSYCINNCAYCSFNYRNKIKRTYLTVEQAVREADAIYAQGFRNILLVAGEDPAHITLDYLVDLVQKLKKKFASVGIEIAPQDLEAYKVLREAGVDSLTLYQETYDKKRYAEVHFNRKADYNYRIEAPERAAIAGIKKINIGVLLGLYNWREDILSLFNHLKYLRKKYWKVQWGLGFPRLRPFKGDFSSPFIISDRDLIYVISLFRVFFPELSIYVSTRESIKIREIVCKVAATHMSAGSKTMPGGYLEDTSYDKQFEIADERPVDEVAAWLKKMGYEPVWKDWEGVL